MKGALETNGLSLSPFSCHLENPGSFSKVAFTVIGKQSTQKTTNRAVHFTVLQKWQIICLTNKN